MFTKEIIEIIQKYQDIAAEEISNINISIDKIKHELKTMSGVLMDEVMSYSKNGSKNLTKELELHNDSIKIREFINVINSIPYKEEQENIRELGIYDVIVVNSILKCSLSNHDFEDVCVFIPILEKSCNIIYLSVLVSYCRNCNQYIMLKDTFDQIDGIILCQVVDESKLYDESTNLNDDEIDTAQKQSILYKYGYNVNAQSNLSGKQRQIILSTVIEAGLMTRMQVSSHLSTLIARGDKIKRWKEATSKWKQDKYYVQHYNSNDLPRIITDKIILKYKYKNG